MVCPIYFLFVASVTSTILQIIRISISSYILLLLLPLVATILPTSLWPFVLYAFFFVVQYGRRYIQSRNYTAEIT